MKKITLFTADIDTKAIIKQLADYKQSLEKLKTAQKSLDTTTAKGAEQFVKNKAEIAKNKVETVKYEKVLNQLSSTTGKFESVEKTLSATLSKEVTTINQARESNKKLLAIRNNLNLKSKEGIASRDKINVQLDKNNELIKGNVSGYEKQKIGIGDYEGALRKVFPSLGGMINGLKSTKEGLQKVGIGFKQGGDAAKTATASFSGVGEAVGSAGITTEQATTSTIGYGSAQTVAGTATDGSAASTIGYAAAQKTATTATNSGSKSLKLFKIALISTGIGAIVVVLGSLIAFLSSTQAGVDAVSKVTKPLSVIFSRLFGVIQDVGAGMFEAFSNPKKLLTDLVDFIKNNVINRFKALAVILEGFQNFDVKQIANGFAQAATGVEDVIGKVQSAGKASSKFLKDSVELGNQLRQIGIDIETKEAAIASQRAKANDEIKKQELIAKDSSKTSKERNDAAKEAARLQDEQITKEEDILLLKIKEMKLEQSQTDTNREDNKELNELEAQLIVKGGERRTSELKFLTATTAFKKEAAKNALETSNKEAAIKKEATDLEIAQLALLNELRDTEQEAEIRALKESYKEKFAIAGENKELKEELNKQIAIDAAAINKKFEDAKTEVIEESQKRAVELEAKHALKMAEAAFNENDLTPDQLAEKGAELAEAQQGIYDIALEALKDDFNNKLISQEEYDISKQILDDSKDETKRDKDRQRDKEEIEAAQSVANAKAKIQDKGIDNVAKGAAILASLDEDNKGLQVASIVAANAAQIAKTVIATQSANAIITAEGLALSIPTLGASVVTAAGLVASNNISAGISIGGMVAAAAKGVSGLRKKAERGISFQGTLQGASHTNGGINLGNGVEAEGGENLYTANGNTHIVNKKASSLINRLGIMGALSFINQREGNGIALNTPTSFAQKGGLISTLGGGNAEIDYSKMAQAFEAGASRVQNTVNVNDINSANTNITEVNDFTTV
jgi:hypothetical protein